MEPQQQRVKKFMEFFGQDTPARPQKLDWETSKLRANLILEEVFETLVDGLGMGVLIEDGKGGVAVIDPDNRKKIKFFYTQYKPTDLVALADGCGDISVVTYGTALAAGIDMEPVEKEIDQSNMSKAWTESDLAAAKEKYPMAKVEKYSENLYRLVREDGKVIKSPSYKPADLEKVIESQL